MLTANEISSALRELEARAGLRVLYACESGSRAWGFPSPDSDYDVRFVYVQPLPWYLTVEPGRDTHEAMLPRALDLSGWELRKTLQLFASCNLALNEWLGSPIVYQSTPWADRLRALVPAFFNPRKAMHHYLSSARGTAAEHLTGDRLRIKKFFYVLRPLLAARFIERTRGMPPTDFASLYADDPLPSSLRGSIDAIVEQKRTAQEGEQIALPDPLRAFLIDEQQRLQAVEARLSGAGDRDVTLLDNLLRDAVLS